MNKVQKLHSWVELSGVDYVLDDINELVNVVEHLF